MASDVRKFDVTKLERKFFHERELTGKQAVLIVAISSIFSAFHIINGSYTGMLPIDIVKSIHLAFVMVLAFLLFPIRKGSEEKKQVKFHYMMWLWPLSPPMLPST